MHVEAARAFPLGLVLGYECGLNVTSEPTASAPPSSDPQAGTAPGLPSRSRPARAWRRFVHGRAAFPLAFVLVYAVHLMCAGYFNPPAVLFGKQPVSGSDYDTHIEQTWRVIEGLQGWGQSWVYDVRLLAGHPNGVIFDADNKGWELLTYLLVSLGVPKSIAFNAFLLLAHMLVVPLVFYSARLFELARWPALAAALLSSWLWLFDSYMHWIWWVGTLAFAFASYFFLLPLALFYRFVREQRALHAVLCALALAIAHLIHPYTFFALVVPMGVIYVRAARSLPWQAHAWVAAIGAVTLAANADWLVQSLRQWHYILDSGFFGQASPAQVVADFFGFVVDTSTTGIIPTRTSVRFLCLAAAGVTLVRYRQTQDARFAPLLAGLAFMLALTYLGGYSKLAHQIQPYRFAGAAAFLAALPAAHLLELLQRERSARALSFVERGALAVLLLLGFQHVAGEAVVYFSGALPEVPPLLDEVRAPITATGYPPFVEYRHGPDHPVLWELAHWVDEQTKRGSGRFLVQTSAIGEQLAWKTDGEILGGFVLRNVQHAYANLFRRRLEQKLTEGQVRAYLEHYAVEWVVLSFPDPWFERFPKLFEWHGRIGGAMVLRTKVPISRFQRGSGDVSAKTNQIRVTHSEPNTDVVIRYHFHEALGCKPDCRILPSRNPVGGVAFIRVPAPHPADFTVYNTYRF